MLKFLGSVIAFAALIHMAQDGFAKEKNQPDVVAVRDTCLSKAGVPIPAAVFFGAPPQMNDAQKIHVRECLQSHGVDVSNLTVLK